MFYKIKFHFQNLLKNLDQKNKRRFSKDPRNYVDPEELNKQYKKAIKDYKLDE